MYPDLPRHGRFARARPPYPSPLPIPLHHHMRMSTCASTCVCVGERERERERERGGGGGGADRQTDRQTDILRKSRLILPFVATMPISSVQNEFIDDMLGTPMANLSGA